MDLSELNANYAQLGDDQLLCLWADRNTLVPEAAMALDSELQRRGLKKENAARIKKRLDALAAREDIAKCEMCGAPAALPWAPGASRVEIASEGREHRRSTYGFAVLKRAASQPTVASIPPQPSVRTMAPMVVSYCRIPRLVKIVFQSCST
jgi:hypothetical protein